MAADVDKFLGVPTEAEETESSFEEFIQEVDELLVDLTPEQLEAIPAPEQVEAVEPAEDPAYEQMQQTFMAIMQQVLRPVTRYIKAVINGVHNREVFEIINFTVTPLIDKVEKVNLFSQTSNLLQFKTVLTRILATHFGTLSEALLQELVSSYMEVNKAFSLDLRGSQRAVGNILGFYRMMCFSRELDVEQIRKFFAIGIPSVTWIRRIRAAEIASLSGMPEEKARFLKRLAVNYREPMAVELEQGPPPTNPQVAQL